MDKNLLMDEFLSEHSFVLLFEPQPAALVSSFMHYSLKWLEKFYCFPSLHLFVFHPSLNLFIQMPHIPFPGSHKRCVAFSLISILLHTKMQFNIFWKRNFYRRKGIFSKGDNHKWRYLFENLWLLEQRPGLFAKRSANWDDPRPG